MSSDNSFKRLNEEDENEEIELDNLNNNNNNNNNDNNNNNNDDNNNKSKFSFNSLNPINQIQNVFNNISNNIDLNPLNVDFQGHRDRFVNFFHTGTDDINNRMQNVVSRIRSNEYRKKMHTVLTKIKDTKEYQSTSNTDYDVIFESVDMYSNLQADPTLDKDEIDVVTDITSYKKKFTHWLAKERISTLLFIPILGILVAIMGLFCDFVLMELSTLRTFITSQHQNGEHQRYDFIEGLIFVGYSVAFAFLSVCCISFISPYAVGSGIPEMKSIMSGINVSRVLGLKTLVSKIAGLICATAAGLTVGRTGPFMHASAIIAQEMMNLKFFSNIKKNQIVRYQMLICALTSGVVANFGAPIGGLLFAIEVTATTAVMGNLWKGFFCGTTTAVIFYFTRSLFKGESFQSVYSFNFISKTYGILDLITFVIIGVITGLIGAFFVFIYEKLVRFRLRYPILKQSRIGLVVVIALFSATITYLAGPFCRIPLSKAMKELLKEGDPADETFTSQEFPAPEYKYYNLLVFIFCKLLLTAFNIILPIPGGAITPFIVTGAGLGRLFGEILKDHFDSDAISPQGYAAIASAGLVSGTIRNISPSIFVLELTGQISLLVPILICSITSTATGNMLNRPLFDTALKIQGLPFLSNYRSSKVYIMTAKQVMRKNINYLSMRSTVKEIRSFLDNFKYTFIPVVDSKDNMLLVGIVERSSIMYMVENHIEIIESKLSEFRDKLKLNIKSINNNNNNNNIPSPQQSTINNSILTSTNNNNNNNNNEEDEEEEENQSLIQKSKELDDGNNNNNSSSSNSSSSDFEEIPRGNNDSLELVKEIEDENNSLSSNDSSNNNNNKLNQDNDDDQDDEDNDNVNDPLVNPTKPILRNRHSNNINNNNNNNTTTTTTTTTTSDQQSSSNNNNNNHTSSYNEETHSFDISVDDLKLKGEDIWGEHIFGDIIQSGESAVLMDLAPSQVPDLTPLNKVFHLFTMLGLGFTFVTSMGRLVGVITKSDLINQDL